MTQGTLPDAPQTGFVLNHSHHNLPHKIGIFKYVTLETAAQPRLSSFLFLAFKGLATQKPNRPASGERVLPQFFC